MRILGIDHGDRRIGLAVSDLLQMTSQALGFYELRGRKTDKEYFRNLVKENQVSEIVIGLPLMMDGTKGERVIKVEEFASWLKRILELPVFFWDERLTTKQAFSILQEQNIRQKKGKKIKDQLSAGIILAGYLEHKRTQAHDTEDN
ncbi:Holliday junction resolvase RuvX [Acidobacteriota bacterium]